MKKSVSKEVDGLKTEWLYYGLSRVPSGLFYNLDIQKKAVDYFRKNESRICRDVFKLVEPLPLSQKHLKPDWKNYYYDKYEDWYTDCLYDLSDIIVEYKAIEHVVPEIKKVVKKVDDTFHTSYRGIPSDDFKKMLVLKMVGIAKDVFVSNRYPVHCNPECKKKLLDCEYMIDKSKKTPEECPKNSHIRKIKREQKRRCADGYIPVIAYLLAKIGILEISKCDLRIKHCLESDCLKERITKNCIFNEDKKLRAYLQVCGINLLCDKEPQNTACNECQSAATKRLLAELNRSNRGKTETEAVKFTDKYLRTQWLNVPLVRDKIRTQAKKNIYSLSNPCPKATKQVYEFIADNNKFWRLDWKKDDTRILYAKDYLKAKNKKKKTKILDEVSRRSYLNRKIILQDIKRTIKKNPTIFNRSTSN